MTLLQSVQDALRAWPQASEARNHIVVPTHCLFGSGGIVRVVVEGRERQFVVHDGAAAIDEFSNNGGDIPKSIKILRAHFRGRGISISDHGEIVAPPVRADELAPAIAHIANAAKEAEEFLMSRWKPRVRRDFKRAMKQMLESEFPHIKIGVRVQGQSAKQHQFDFAVETAGGGKILLDAVAHDPNAITSAVVRNLDVKRGNPLHIQQRIIYDDSEDWRAEDLSLLMLGATVVAFSDAPSVLHRLAA